jgi:hypothetical protein
MCTHLLGGIGLEGEGDLKLLLLLLLRSWGLPRGVGHRRHASAMMASSGERSVLGRGKRARRH